MYADGPYCSVQFVDTEDQGPLVFARRGESRHGLPPGSLIERAYTHVDVNEPAFYLRMVRTESLSPYILSNQARRRIHDVVAFHHNLELPVYGNNRVVH